MFKFLTRALALATLLCVHVDAHIILGSSSGVDLSGGLGLGINENINTDLSSGASKIASNIDINTSLKSLGVIKTPVTLRVTQEQPAELKKKVAMLNDTKPVSSSVVTINGQEISVPVLTTDKNLDKNKKAVSVTMNNFAETLKSVTDEEECECDPKDSSKSVRQVVEATSRLCQDLLRCLLDSLKSKVSQREATLIRAMTKESMDSLSRSVDGIYSIWKMSDQESKSVQTVVDGLMNVLNKFSSRITIALSSDTNSRLETVSYVVNSLVGLVANTSRAIAIDLNENMSSEQLQQAMILARDLAEPLTSSALAQFVKGTARIPMINKMMLQFVIDSQSLTKGCAGPKKVQVSLNKAILESLSQGLLSMNIRVGTKDPSIVASEAHRAATTNFLLKLIEQIETVLKGAAKVQTVTDTCKQRAGEGLSNVVAIVKSIIDNIQPEIKDSKARQQTILAGDLAKGFADIINVLGTGMVRSQSVNGHLANITNCIYQQLEVIRRFAKNDQDITRDSDAGIKKTIVLLTDVARLEIRYVQISIDRMKNSKDSGLRMKTVRDATIEIVRLLTIIGREVAPASNNPLNKIVQKSGDSLIEVLLQLEKLFSSKPHTYGDVLYEVFYSLLETGRRLVQTASNPSRAGIPTTAPTDVIYYTSNSIRTAIDWSNALTRSSGIDVKIQEILVRYVIIIIQEVRKSHVEYEKDNSNIDDSVNKDLDNITEQLGQILQDMLSGKKTTTQGPIDYYDYSDESDKTPSSGLPRLDSILQNLDDILNYVIEGGLKSQSSLVTRNSETIIHVIAVLLEEVTRTPQLNEDGSIILPGGGIIKPCTGGSPGPNTGVSTTPMPSSPVTKPPQTTTTVQTTIKGRGGDDDNHHHGGHTGQPTGQPGPSTSSGKPGESTTTEPSTYNPSSGHPGHQSSSRKPGESTTGRPSTGHPSGPTSTDEPGQPTSGKPSTGRPSTGRPSTERPSTGKPSTGHPSSGHPSGPTSTGKPGQPTSGRPSTGHPSSGHPSGPTSTGKPGQPSTGRPSTGHPSGPTSSHKPGQPTTGRPSTGHPSGPTSSHKPGQPTTGRPSTGHPSSGHPSGPTSSHKPGQPTTGRPSTGHPSSGHPSGPTSTGKPGQPSTGRPSTGHPSGPTSSHKPGQPTTGRPSTGHPSGPTSSHRPGQPTTGRPSTGHPSSGHPSGPTSSHKPGQPTTGRPSTGHPSSGHPSGPTSTGKPGQPTSGRPSTGHPSTGHPSSGHPSGPTSSHKPGQPTTGRPTTAHPSSGHPSGPTSTGKPGQPTSGRPSTGQPEGPTSSRKPGHSSTGPTGYPTGSTGSPPNPTSTPRTPRGGDSCDTNKREIDILIERLVKEANINKQDLTSFQESLKLILSKIRARCKSSESITSSDADDRIVSDILSIIVANQPRVCPVRTRIGIPIQTRT